MKTVSKLYRLCLIGILWGLFGLYLICFDNLLLSPKDIYEVILPSGLQILMLWILSKLFKDNYYNAISSTFIICVGLVIFWHFSLNHRISRKIVINLFSLVPPLVTAAGYFVNKIKLKIRISIFKYLSVVLFSSFINFIIAVFTFYIFHYWI